MDWLRIFAILAVYLVHTLMPFQTVPGVWLIQYPSQHVAFALFPAFTLQWIMPLAFFLSGAGTRVALASRGRIHYLATRARRLLVPLVFGILAFTAFQQYLSLNSQPPVLTSAVAIHAYMASGEWPDPASQDFVEFYPQWLWSCLTNPGLGLLRIECLASHLWFLAYLFIFSVLCLPVFSLLERSWGARWVIRLAALSQSTAGLAAFFIPTAMVQILLRARFPQHQNWSDFLVWLEYFIYGYLFTSDPRFFQSVKKHRAVALYTGLACFAGILLLLGPLGYSQSWELQPTFTAGYAAYQALRSLDTWAWVLFFLGTGLQRMNFNSAWLAYGREAVLPFYILHQVVIVALGVLLYRWDPPALLKYLVLAGGAFLIIWGIYARLIRRIRALRFLFGMRL